MERLTWTTLLLVLASTANAAVITVPDDYPTIGTAIAASSPGDEIQIRNGTYTELLLVPHDLTLSGIVEGGVLPIVSGGGSTAASVITLQPPAAVRIVGLQISNGRAPNGGAGIRAPQGTELWLDDCYIYNNGRSCDTGASGPGGVAAALLHATNSAFRFNDGGTGVGAVSMDAGELIDCEMESNVAGNPFPPPGCTGVVAGVEIKTGTIERCRFSHNSSKAQVASLLARNAVTIRDCEFFGHNIPFEGGIGAIVRLDDDATIERCTFRNTFDGSGGIPLVDCHDGTQSLIDCKFVNNINGVGIRALVRFDHCTATVTRCLFAGNAMGPIDTYSTNLTVENCTMVDNYGPGTLISVDGSLVLRKSIIAGNHSEHPIYCYQGPTVFECNDFWSNNGASLGCPAGVNDFGADPLFCDRAAGDYTLNSASPCAPGNSPPGCGLIGAFPVECGVTAVPGESAPAFVRLTVIPNPVRGAAHFTLGTVAAPARMLNIFDSAGRLVAQLQSENGGWEWLPGASVPAGVYFANADGMTTPEAIKFLVLR